MGQKKGCKFTHEHRRRIGESKIGYKHSNSAKLNMSKARTGVKLTEQHKNKIALAGMGRKHSEETKQKMRDSWHKTHKKNYIPKRKKFCPYEHNTDIIGRNRVGRCLTCLKEDRWRSVLNYNGHRFTINDYNRSFQIQGGRCKICGRHQSELKGSLHVDHNHQTGYFRWLLCVACNQGLGMFKDNPDLLENAAKCLREISEMGETK